MMRILWTLRGKLQYILARGLLKKKKNLKEGSFFAKKKSFPKKKKSFVNNVLRSEIFKKKKREKFSKIKNKK